MIYCTEYSNYVLSIDSLSCPSFHPRNAHSTGWRFDLLFVGHEISSLGWRIRVETGWIVVVVPQLSLPQATSLPLLSLLLALGTVLGSLVLALWLVQPVGDPDSSQDAVSPG